MSFKDQIAIIQANVKAEPYVIFENFGFSSLDLMIATVKECLRFYNTISAKPRVFLPKHVSNFYYNWRKAKQPENITIHISIPSSDGPVNALQLIVRTFNLQDTGSVLLDDITLEDMHGVFKEITMGGPAFTPKAFLRHYLQPEFRILCDYVQKVFLSFQGSFKTVTP